MVRASGPNQRSRTRRGPGDARPGSARRGSTSDQRANPRRPSQKGKSEPATTRLTGRAIVLLSVVLLLLASYTSSLHAWWSQHQQIESEKASIAAKKEDIASMEKEQGRLDDDAYIEQQARRRFGWVMPGEVGYRVIGMDGEVEGDAPELADSNADKPQEWYGKLWGTVTESGKEPAKDSGPKDDRDKVLKEQ